MSKGKKIIKVTKKYQRFISGTIAVLWIFSSIVVYKAITTPLEIRRNITDNKITTTTDYSYTANVKQSALYKSSSLDNPEGTIFYKLLDSLVIKINSRINSDKPISGGVKSKVTLELTGEDLSSTVELLPEQKVYNSTLGNSNESNLVKDDITINMKDMVDSCLDNIEQQTGYRPNKYNIKLKTEIVDGNVVFNGNKVNLDGSSELNFEYSNGQIKRVGETSFKKDNPINISIVEPQKLSFIGMAIPLKEARYIFITIWILLSTAGAAMIKQSLKDNKKIVSEADQIEKKYGNRFAELEQRIEHQGRLYLPLKTFRAMMNISDDKDLPILKFVDTDRVIYYIYDNNCIYSYNASKINTAMPVRVSSVRVGSELANEK